MANVRFKGKDRRGDDGSTWWTNKEGDRIFIGRDWAHQNDIDDTKARTKARACFRECLSCGCCKASCRDNTVPKAYDDNAGKSIACSSCEKYRFCDCRNGFMRNTRGEAEPFTQDQLNLIAMAEDKRPLM